MSGYDTVQTGANSQRGGSQEGLLSDSYQASGGNADPIIAGKNAIATKTNTAAMASRGDSSDNLRSVFVVMPDTLNRQI